MPIRAWALALPLIFVAAEGLSAQIPIEFSPSSRELSRADLQHLLEQYEEAIASPAYSDQMKDAARVSAGRIRERLEEGDFKVGDRVALTVQGEPNLPDTLTVEPGPQITVPLFGSISLAGVLRSEIQEHLTRELGKTIHDPVVRAKGLMRLSVQGAVGAPGFYVVPADVLVSEAVMIAGGPGGNADLEKIRVVRGMEPLLSGPAMQDALLEGRTLDQLNLQAGDQLYVPQKQPNYFMSFLRYGLPTISALIVLVKIF